MPQNFIDTDGGIYTPGVVLIDKATGLPSNVSVDFRSAVVAGLVSGATAFTITGHSPSIQTSECPCLLWDSKTAYQFQTTAQSLEVVSSSSNDTSSGTGARLVKVDTLASDLTEQSQIIALNGATPVALSGTHLHVNSVTVVSSGSVHTNVGNISVKTVGSSTLQGFIAAGIGIQRAMKFTVPKGKRLLIDNFYVNAINFGGQNIRVTLAFVARLPDGTLLTSQTNYFSGNNAPLSISLPTGLGLDEGVTLYASLQAVSANDANFAMSVSGCLLTLANL